MTACKFVGHAEPRILPGRHGDECPGGECPGCQPCLEPHCRVCGYTHVEGTCAECLGATREDLHAIAQMCDALPAEVVHRGVNSEAMTLLGPAADPEAWGHLTTSVKVGRLPEDYLAAVDGDLHPEFVLTGWDMVWRDALDHDEPKGRLALAESVDYLDRQMTYMAGYEHAPFEDFARDLRRCRAHLEAVLHDGEQVEKGAPCLKCKRPVTRKTSADGKLSFECERCNRTLSDNEYRLAVKTAHIAHADRLSSDDMAIRLDVKASTVRRWASRRTEWVESHIEHGQLVPAEKVEHAPLLRSCGVNSAGRKVYKVADVARLAGIDLDAIGDESIDKQVS